MKKKLIQAVNTQTQSSTVSDCRESLSWQVLKEAGRRTDMQRKVVQIAKKYLKEGYDDNQTEIAYLGPWSVLSMYVDAQGNHTDDKIRAFAKEVVSIIRGVKLSELIICPSKEEIKRMLFDIYPNELGNPNNKESEAFVDYNADYVLEWLKRIDINTHWRGKRI